MTWPIPLAIDTSVVRVEVDVADGGVALARGGGGRVRPGGEQAAEALEEDRLKFYDKARVARGDPVRQRDHARVVMGRALVHRIGNAEFEQQRVTLRRMGAEPPVSTGPFHRSGQQ
jgi:hypothetical protein